MPHILLLGGHGKISLLLTPKLLSRSWNVTSLIRTAEQKPTILDASKYGSGNVDVLVSSLQDVRSDEAAKKILQTVKPDWVVWSAGLFYFFLFSISFLQHNNLDAGQRN